MSADIASRYIQKVNTKLRQVEETDSFASSFSNAIKTGKNTLYQKHLSETRIFDGTWIDKIESMISSIDLIVRDPKSFIKANNEIVPIERAKKTTSEAIRHLASHSQYVRDIDSNDGTVIPSKILTVFREEDIGIYENRFVKTLIEKLTIFVERRYEVIAKLIGTDYLNKLNSKSVFKYEDIDIEYEINMTVKREIRDSILERKNFELLERVEDLRKNILNFRRSDFSKALVNAKPVYPPIMKTNIITKHPDYRRCYELWMFLDSYDKLDYTIEMYDNEINFSDEYIESLHRLVTIGFSTVVANDDSELGRIKTKARLFKKQRKTRILESLRQELAAKEDTTVKIEENSFNEYYLQEAKKIYNEKVENEVENGEPFHMAVQDAYKESYKISEAIFEQFLEIPDDIKNDRVACLRHRLRTQKAIENVISFKEKDLKKMKKMQVKMANQLENEKKKMEVELAREREIDKLRAQGMSEEEIKEKMMTPEERAKKKERDRIRALKEKEKEAKAIERKKVLEAEKAKLKKEKEIKKQKEKLEKEKLRKKELEKKRKEKLREKEAQKKLKAKKAKSSESKTKKKSTSTKTDKLVSSVEKTKSVKTSKRTVDPTSSTKKTNNSNVNKTKKMIVKNNNPQNDKNNNEVIDFAKDSDKIISKQEKLLLAKQKSGNLTDQEKDILDKLIAERETKLSAAHQRRIDSLKRRRRENLGNNNFGDKGSIILKFDDKK